MCRHFGGSSKLYKKWYCLYMLEKWNPQFNPNRETQEKTVKIAEAKELSKDEREGVFSDSQKKLIDQLKDLAQKLNRTPTVYDIDQASKEGASASAHAFRREFNTLNEARKAANLVVNREFKKENYVKPNRKDNFSIENSVPEITSLLEKLKPEKFSPFWLEKNNFFLYRRLAYYLPRNEEKQIDWQPFIKQLPKEWQEKWTYNKSSSQRYKDPSSLEQDISRRIQECVSKTVTILEEKKPKQFNSNWLEKNNVSYYKLKSLLPRNENNQINWKLFVEQLPKEWQEKWTYLGYDKDIKEYSNEGELGQILKSFKDKLYVLPYYSNNTKEDRWIANQLVWRIVKLAQNGNTDALATLEKDLHLVCAEWIQKYPELRSWKIAPQKLKKIIKSCIYNFKYKGTFFSYLFETLKMEKIRMPKIVRYKHWMRKKDDSEEDDQVA